MGKLVFCDFEVDVPASWKDQGMVTLTMPSTDPKVRPNIIITKERLPQAIDLESYFARIKQSVQQRGIQSFQILEEKDVVVGGIAAKQMICSWDLSQMKQMMGANNPNLEHIQPGQMVQQIQVSLVKGDEALNLTASFPADQFAIYSRPFHKFIEGLKFL